MLPAQHDSTIIRSIYDHSLSQSDCFKNLEILCRNYPKRLAGSPGAASAVEWTKKIMDDYGFDSVWLQPVMVPHWVNIEKERAAIMNADGSKTEVTVCALGNSIGTGPGGISASIIEVKNFEELVALGKKSIEGKIVFYNRPMDPLLINTFEAYGGAVNQRHAGAVEAAKYGAVGVVVRSMTLNLDDYPHTGAMRYDDTIPKIPACAISTIGAELLSNELKNNPSLKFYFRQNCGMQEEVLSYNVIGEIKGSEHPEEVIVVGGHLDAWETGDGAHDDGAGCVQSIEVLRIFNELGMKPKHTIRCVMFMNEENGLRGAKEYAKVADEKNEIHVFAVESDAGGFVPRGFGLDGPDSIRNKIIEWCSSLEPYGIHAFYHWGGADISPLKEQGCFLAGLAPDSQRYFDVHHAATDVMENINKRELELGAAAIAALIYLVDKNGLK